MIYQLDTENADLDLASGATVITDTPHATKDTLCQAYIKLGDGTKNLDGTGGNFTYTIVVGGQTVQASPKTVVFSTAVRSSFWTEIFPVLANEEVVISLTSPNAADSDVDVTAYLFDLCTITSNKYDGTTAFPIVSADSGATAIARAGADSDTLKTLSEQLDAETISVALIKAKTDNLPGSVPKGVAFSNFSFVMFSSQDHVTPSTGLSVEGKVSKDGGAFVDLTGSVSAIAYGYYKVDITNTEMNADVVSLRFTAAGADAALFTIKTDS